MIYRDKFALSLVIWEADIDVQTHFVFLNHHEDVAFISVNVEKPQIQDRDLMNFVGFKKIKWEIFDAPIALDEFL